MVLGTSQRQRQHQRQRGVLDPTEDRDLIAETLESLKTPRADDIPWEKLREELFT